MNLSNLDVQVPIEFVMNTSDSVSHGLNGVLQSCEAFAELASALSPHFA